MLNIKFEVNEDILLRQIVQKSKMPVDFANYLWDKYNDSYIILKNNFLSENIDFNILKELKKQSFFSAMLQQAKENCERIQQNWIIKNKEINDYLKKIFKMDFVLEIKAFIVSPNLNSGQNIGNNCFVWGHQKGISDENYDLVYLVHESLHSFFNKDNLSHAIIEKIADIELAKILNKTTLGYETHDFTKKEHIRIFPFWNLYMKRTKREIVREQKLFNIKYDIDKFEVYRERIQKMNIFELIDFLKVEAEKIITSVKLDIKNL